MKPSHEVENLLQVNAYHARILALLSIQPYKPGNIWQRKDSLHPAILVIGKGALPLCLPLP